MFSFVFFALDIVVTFVHGSDRVHVSFVTTVAWGDGCDDIKDMIGYPLAPYILTYLIICEVFYRYKGKGGEYMVASASIMGRSEGIFGI